MTSIPRSTSAGARAATSTKQIPSCGAVCITMCPSLQSIATTIVPVASRIVGGPWAGIPTAPAAATTMAESAAVSDSGPWGSDVISSVC